jgi:NAD(P)H-flavin reductase/hemoglobin-like flavoprotein
MDPARLQASWARVVTHGAAVPSFFYAWLFLAYPQLREMFPVSMAAQQDRLVAALGRIVSTVDTVSSAVPFIQQLGRDHRKFAVRAEHYPMIGEALLATLAHFLDDEWTPPLAADWTEAYVLVADVMTKAAADAERDSPAWWDAEVVGHERRGFDIAVLWIRPQAEYAYLAGQSVALQTPLRRRVWRHFSPANAQRADGTIELHVRAVPGGQVSNALVAGVQRGDILTLGPPVGAGLVLDEASGRDVLMLAGGTGLAPLKALIDHLARTGAARRTSLFLGARTAASLYDLPALERLTAILPWLSVVPVLSDDAWHPAEPGTPVDAALRLGRWFDRDVYVCGSPEMVAGSVGRLREAGIPDGQIHVEDLDLTPVPLAEEVRTW